jgi:hypothetical protein
MGQRKSIDFELGDVTSLVGLIGAGAICLSIAKQLGFFIVVDLKMLSFMAIEDLLSNSLSYVPITIFAIVTAVWVQRSQGMLPGIPLFRKFASSKIPNYDMKANLIVIVLAFLFVDHWPSVAMLSLIFFYGAVMSWLETKDTQFPKWVLGEAAYAMYIMAIAFVLGASEGISALKTTTLNYELELKSGKVLQANLLRTTSDVVIVRQDLKTVSAISRDEIIAISRLDVGPREAPISVVSIWIWLKSWWSSVPT